MIYDLRVASRKCVVCGSEADSFCARCGVTPYCSARCQQRDWAHRHRDVCHNLARDPKFEAEEDLSIVRPPAPALRRPHSPAQQRDSVNPTRDSDSPRNDDGATGANRKFMPAGFNKKPENSGFRYKNENSGPRNNNDNSGFRNKNENSGSREDNENSGFRKNNENSGFRKNNENSGFRKNDENSGSRRNNENSGFRKNDENSGFRKNNENSGFRKNDENSGFRKNDENSGFRKNHENSGFRKNDENSGFRKNNDDSGSRNNSTRGRPFNRGQDGGTGSGRNNQRYQNNGNRRTPNQPADEEEDWDSAKRSYPRGGSRGDRYKPFNQPLPLSDNDEEDWALKSIKPAEPAQAQETKPEPKEVKHTPPPKREPPKAAAPAQRAEAAREAPKAASMPPSSVDDVTPAKKIVPKNYVIETFSIGDTVLLQVDAAGAECRARAGFVCLALHERLGEQFESLCDTFAEECEADAAEYTLVPGESFAYLDAEDGGWYRARCLTPALAALLDASKLVPTAGCKCRKLPAAYELLPEFCCLLLSAHVKIGDSLRCTLQEKTPNGYKVTLENVETAAKVGDAEVTRWLPEVEYPKPAPPPARVVPAAAAPAVIPEVPRPDVAGNSKVLLVDMMALDRGFVRAADTPSQMQFDAVLQDVVLYGMSAKPLTEPPQKGQLVIAKYTDDMHYRALLKRTNVKQNKYLLEYVEFGNIQVTSLDSLYPCPVELQLQARPAMTSQVSLLSGDGDVTLTPAAIEHLEKIKDDNEELLLTLPSGAKAAPSGATVTLTVTKSNENLNRKLQAMCTPEWKQIEERGGDVIESECLMYNDLKYVDLPADGCELDILDITMIRSGTLSGCVKGLPLADYVFNQLTEKMGKYCNSELGREPYLPKAEELCIAQCPPYPQWFRAVFVGQEAGAGGAEAEVCYLDYGNLERVPVKLLRKMLPEFVRDLPAVANTLEIKDFPHDAPPEVLAQALQFMQVTNEGRGVLRAQRCVRDLETPGMYVIEAPDLIAALKGAIDRQA